jgi:tetratricopeptide (TPR) repeat protein
MSKHPPTPYVALCPNDYAKAQSAPTFSEPVLRTLRVVSLDADFDQGGTWAGAAALVEHAYHECVEAGLTELLDRHNYELHMALPGLRDRIPLKHGSLTDIAEGSEKTRNYSIDRAYRIAHGLVDFLLGWRGAVRGDARLLVLAVDGIAKAQHLSQRFLLELARRGPAANLLVAVSGDDARLPVIEAASPRLACVKIDLASPPVRLRVSEAGAPIACEAEAESCFKALGETNAVEIQSRRLRAYYRATGNALGHARASLAALGACNHFGYYHEARSFVADVLPYLDQIIDGDEERRWNCTGNIYHSLLVTGAAREGLEMIEKLAKPYLTRLSLRAKMEYIFGIHELRFSDKTDLAVAETHLVAATQLIAAAGHELSPEDFCFQRVFNDNGLALLRVRQKRRDEAIALCQSGFKLLDEVLSPETHKLHRSVLQYNTAQVYAMMGEFEAALTHFRHAISMDPNYSEYYNEMGNIFQRQERFDEALAAYVTAVRLSPPYPEVHFNMALCLARHGEWEAAMAACRRTLELNPDQLDAQMVLAEIYQQLGMAQAALGCYEQAIALDPASVVARMNKTAILFNMDRFEEALAAMDDVIALDPNEPTHHENRANIVQRLDAKRALAPMETAL